MMAIVQRALRKEMDRLAGEILRRDAETDVCLTLYARRGRLRACAASGKTCRAIRELLR